MSNDDFLAKTETESLTVSQLIVGDADVVTEPVTLITGQNLAQYTVLGRIAASGKVTQWAPAASDGSQTAIGILMHSINATSADKGAVMYIGGEFNRDLLVWPAGATALQKQIAFDRTNIRTRSLAYSG